MEITIENLIEPARIAIAITAISCAFAFYKIFKENGASPIFLRRILIWMLIMAFLVSHTSLLKNSGAYLPAGVVPGFVLAFLSLLWKPAKEAFDKLSDVQIRYLMSYRMVFGAFLIAGAALRFFPPIFAITAGIGDLLAGWLAALAPVSLNGTKNKFWSALVHGWGVIDLLDVAALGTFVVQPWLVENNSPGPSFLLPWMAVPLLLALNLHGLRKVFLINRFLKKINTKKCKLF